MKNILTTFLGSAALVLLLCAPGSAQALTISPPTFEYALNPGDTVLDVIKIFNEDTLPVTVYPLLQNFTFSGDESGAPRLYSPEEDRSGTALAPWITVSPEGITVKPSERANLSFAINVPKDARPGGHYGAIMLSTTPPKGTTSQVGVSSQLGALILVRVSGDIKEAGAIAEFGFIDKKVWYNYLPVDFFLRFENSGNTHLQPTGNLFITNMFGRQVASIPINEEMRNVLPMSIRRFTFGWRKGTVAEDDSEMKKELKNFAIGKYKATLVVNYGDSQQMLSEQREFTVWPWRTMIAGGVILLLALVALWLITRKYNTWLIRRYERGHGHDMKK